MESDDVATFSKFRPLRRGPHRPPKRAPPGDRFCDDCDGVDAGVRPGLRVGSAQCAVAQPRERLCGGNLDNGQIEREDSSNALAALASPRAFAYERAIENRPAVKGCRGGFSLVPTRT